MPRVLRILNRFNLGGPTYNAAYLTKYMSPEYETLLIGGENDEKEKNSEFIVKNLGVKYLVVKGMKRSLSISDDIVSYNKIKTIIKRFKPDIVHTHASKAGVLGRMAASKLNVPVIVHTFHGHVFDSYFSKIQSTFYKNVERKMAEKSSKIIAISEIQKNDLVNKYRICPADKIEIIPLGLDLSRFQENISEKRLAFRKKYNLSDDEIAISIIGRLVAIKNHKLFINAINEVLKKTTKKVRAFIVGGGEEKENLMNYANSLGISYTQLPSSKQKNSINFTSWIKEIDVVIAGSDIIALTSLNEGTPVSLIEAQAGSKPIVTTAVGGIEDVVIPNETALLSKNNHLPSFVKNLLLLVENDNLRSEISVKGLNYVMNKYHYSRLVSDMKNLYSRLLSEV